MLARNPFIASFMPERQKTVALAHFDAFEAK